MRFTGVSLVVLLAVSLPLLHPAPAAPAEPLGSAETNWSGVTLDLTSVERKGSVLTVKWAVHNRGESQVEVKFGLVGKHVTTYVVDEDSGTKYYALTDQEGNLVASQHVYIGSDTHGISEYVPAGQSKRYWTKMPAPPAEVKALTVFFAETEPFEEIAITDR
ncbi:MAG TPA: hypothetical protein VGG06_12160 [Thermoanaerobaculia bacterium]|jgi:hypothetical protein